MSGSQCLRSLRVGSMQRSPALWHLLPAASPTTRHHLIASRHASTALSSHRIPRSSCPRSQDTLLRPTIPLVQLRNYADKIVKVPEMAESITEGTLKQFSKQVGDYVERDEEIATIETDKIDVAVNAPDAGTIKELLVKEDDTVNVGQDLLRLELGGDASSGGGKQEAKQQPKEPASENKKTAAHPDGGKEKQAKKDATKEESKQPASKEETSPQPQLTNKQEQPSSHPAEPETKNETAKAAQGSSGGPFGKRDERRVKMNRMRLRISERLKQSQNTAASLTTFNEVDMSSLMEFRKLYKDDILKKTGVKLGFMSAFSKACCLAIKELPSVNASIEGPGAGDTIVYKDYVDISVAVATEKGLVTPVVRNAESMDMVSIEKEIASLGKKARDNKLTIEDMAGGTFTISNGGVFGSLMGTPIINLPQTAVLGLHAIKDKPVAVDGKIEIRPMMYLALTYDHRLLDGREAVTFLVRVKEFIEDPRKMLLG